MIFNFYSQFLPQIEIHRNGRVAVAELDLVLKGVLLAKINLTAEIQNRVESEIDQLRQLHVKNCGLIDFYGQFLDNFRNKQN